MKLEDRSLEELWTLFPIVLKKHQEDWKSWYEAERGNLRALLRGCGEIRIHHIGSTAVPGLMAKPTVDIIVELGDRCELAAASRTLQQHGYLCMSESASRISLNKGYTPEGFADRVFHVHLRTAGDTPEIIFRDYLRTHPEAASEYEKLKLDLWNKYEHDRDAYTDGKTEFVSSCLKKARGGH